MTIKTEYRLVCDYCGSVSPVCDGSPAMPRGWVAITDPRDKGILRIGGANPSRVLEFCIPAHREAWLAQLFTPPRPEPRPLHEGVKRER